MFRWFIERRKERKRLEELYEFTTSEIHKLQLSRAKSLFIELNEKFSEDFWIGNHSNDNFEGVKDLLPEHLSHFFETYALSDFVCSELVISSSSIKHSELHSECICIGEDGFDAEVVILPKKEDIYVLYNDDPNTEITAYLKEGAPSIYHFIIEKLCINDQIYEYVNQNL
ncbi:hypothetical protein NBRC116583_36150 [Arenicella sp. 4NH20-0111]|uniref:hypothetical protein n=1 Tax=Arenicella sp. 4NH20-0111 TaxID=3127648 RepID=UPI003102A571